MPVEQTAERVAEELAAVLQTPERYAKMREAAKNLASHQSWNRVANEFLVLVDSPAIR
jgi:UDP-N-acetylglucosamine:LPS N-acetylglucosamine transferase